MQVPDVESPAFWEKMNYLVDLNTKLVDIEKGSAPSFVKALMKAPLMERLIATCAQIYFMTPKDTGSLDLASTEEKVRVAY